jgi:hypothetical protein
MNLNIFPNPLTCAEQPGGVNSVVFDHAVGFLHAGHSIQNGEGINIAHAIAQTVDLDVFHCHGLYPIGPDHFDPSYSRLNEIVLANALRAKVTICISEFSANILRHKLHIDPIVTRNGIYVADYPAAGNPRGPVLFPKTALDANAKAGDVIWLRQNSQLNLLSIAPIPGVKSLGHLSRPEFLDQLRRCGVYLGTTKENNSMATMEAMCSGVPVVGYDFGFASEWLTSGVGCELVPPGDHVALLEAIRSVLGNWKRYSKQAREYAQIFDWQPVIEQLLGIYERVGQGSVDQTVSIIIPCHNYGQYVGEAIESALAQSVPCEVIAIDDCSTDDSRAVLDRYANRIKVLHNRKNLGVAATRNRAIAEASGRFIVCLDADDRLKPEFVAKHLAAFQDRADAIAYAPIELMDEEGNPGKGLMFKASALPALQRQGRNQIPSCCMFRKTFWERAGGYEGRYSPAEDAQLWLKIFALGGTPRRASTEPLMEYRMHGGSLSTQGFPDWWKDLQPISYNAPIVERDPEIQIVIVEDPVEDPAALGGNGLEGAQETLWSLESQTLQNWSASLPAAPNELAKTFPWLNKGNRADRSLVHLKSGEILPPSFLSEYAAQPPAWLSEPRSRSSSRPISGMIRI